MHSARETKMVERGGALLGPLVCAVAFAIAMNELFLLSTIVQGWTSQHAYTWTLVRARGGVFVLVAIRVLVVVLVALSLALLGAWMGRRWQASYRRAGLIGAGLATALSIAAVIAALPDRGDPQAAVAIQLTVEFVVLFTGLCAGARVGAHLARTRDRVRLSRAAAP